MKIFLALWYAMKALARLAMIGMAMAVLGSGSAHAPPARPLARYRSRWSAWGDRC